MEDRARLEEGAPQECGLKAWAKVTVTVGCYSGLGFATWTQTTCRFHHISSHLSHSGDLDRFIVPVKKKEKEKNLSIQTDLNRNETRGIMKPGS